MPTYYAVGGVIDLLKPKRGFFGGFEGPYQKISYEFLKHSLYQNFRSRCGTHLSNQAIPQIYLFETLDEARIFSNHRQNKAYTDHMIALSPIFTIKVNDLEFEFQSSRLVDIPLATYPTASKIELIEENELDNFLKQAAGYNELYGNRYLVIKKDPFSQSKVFYIHENGKSEKIQINDMEKFLQEFDSIRGYNINADLTDQQVNRLITQNGGHIPNCSFKKEAEKIQKEISWAKVENSDFSEFKKNCTIEEIELPGYVKDEDGIYYWEHLKREANRSLFDLNWLLVCLATFWTVFIPIGYTIGRLVNRSSAKGILQNINVEEPLERCYLNPERWSNAQTEYEHCLIQESKLAINSKESKKDEESILSDCPFHEPIKQQAASSKGVEIPKNDALKMSNDS